MSRIRNQGAKAIITLLSSTAAFQRLVGWWAFAVTLSCIAAPLQVAPNPKPLSIAELERGLSDLGETTRSFRLEGTLLAAVAQQGVIALQDVSGAMLLELPSLDSKVSVGEQVAIEVDHCLVVRTRFGVRVSAIPTVENDGLHPEREKSGRVFLNSGLNPIHVTWFNGPSTFALKLEYEGPGISRRRPPNSVLWHRPNEKINQTNLVQGIYYNAYEGNNWASLPDFSFLNPTAEGVATNFSAAYRTRDENCGLTFEGLIQIPHSGFYTFYLASDDGSRLYVGKPSVSCTVLSSRGSPIPPPESFDQALIDRTGLHWIEIQGEATFVSENQRSLEMELLAGGNHVAAMVLDGKGLSSTDLLHHWLRVEGICEFSRGTNDKRLVGVFVPGASQTQVYGSVGNTQSNYSQNVLTTAAQVRRLKPAEADRHLPVKFRGVVIYSTPSAVVLEDSSGGVFVSSGNGRWTAQPGIGELWAMQGTTDPGDFSPVVVANQSSFLGYAPMPEPILPTRDQLMNGNLDAEYGELRGVVTSVSGNEITLLTLDGKISVIANSDRPLPQLPNPTPGGIIGSVVRIRGCFATLVNTQTHQVTPGKVFIYPASVEVEDPSPLDPFLLPMKTPSDLMWFNARASALLRTKLSGQIIHALPGEYFVLDGSTGFRVLASHAPPLAAGDLIEAVGFPKLGGPGPVLQAAQIRKTGHSRLPQPVRISFERLLDRNLDSTWVEVEATLIADTVHPEGQTLELQSGSRHFVARLKSDVQKSPSLPAGCRLKLTGVYASAAEDEGLGASAAPFEILLNDANDIVVLQRPSWWTIRHAVTLVVALAGLLCMTFIWVALLREKVEQRTAQLKKEIGERQLVEQHHAIEQERARVAQDLHDELGAGLTEVSLLGSLANTPAIPAETKKHYLDQLTHTARSLVTSLDEIVWAVNPYYDSVASLVSYFSLFAESFLNLAGITCRLRVMDEIPEYPLDSKQRHEVFCAFKEALNNVIRYSKATEVQIVFRVVERRLVLSVIDNGCGFEFAAEVPGKDGLAGLRRRIHQLGGSSQITSQRGQGTKVEMSLPLSESHHGQSCNR